MKYIFPRQFGLHNVFTSVVNSKETVQPFKDYTLREQEIVLSEGKTSGDGGLQKLTLNVPKRLRGATFDLVKALGKKHSRCSYHQLLKYYCPLKVSDNTSFIAETAN